MAKVVQISNDGGSTWVNLPGSLAGVDFTSEEADDTILGQTFKSGQPALIEWDVSSNGVYKGFAGYLAEIKKQGTSTATTGEACSQESGQIYAVDEGTKEILDRSATLTVYDGATDVTDELEWVDYLFGRFKFQSSYTVGGAVTIDANYFPVEAIGKGRSYTLTMQADAVDTTDFKTAQDNGGYKTFEPGLRTVTLEIQGVFDSDEDAKTDLADRSELIVEIDPAGDGSSIARGFFKIVETGQQGNVGALEEETINFSLSVPQGDLIEVVFNWKHTSTTLAAAIQYAITSWLTELNTYDVQYLPSGSTGESPLDGITGDVVFTDISLSGDLNGMNIFNIGMRGTGAFTKV